MATATALDLAASRRKGAVELRKRTQAAATKVWRDNLDIRNLDASWTAGVRPKLLGLVMVAQAQAATGSDDYTAAVLAAQGLDPNAELELVPSAFAGVASDGRPLDSLLYSPVTATKTAIGQGATNARALASGLGNLQMIVGTQVSDAGRVADGVSLTAHKAATGYVRVLAPPSCARCAILAGKWFKWNQGFQRHPLCDCWHLPSVEVIGKDSLSDPRQAIEAGEVNGLTHAELRAITDGADPAAVVNSRRGMYEARGRKFTNEARRRYGHGGIRLRPEQIYRDARTREEALELLDRFGYIRSPLPKVVEHKPVIPKQRSPIDELPRITSPKANLTEEARLANPHYGADHAYGVNCTHVAQTVEMRARGYDVQATRLPDGFYSGIVGNGRSAPKVLDAIWRTPDGSSPGSRIKRMAGGTGKRSADALVKSWPEGARGMVVVAWKGGNGHIFNVEKRGGRAVYIEGQTSFHESAAADASRHFQRVQTSWVARTDDLILRTDANLSEFFVPHGAKVEPPSPRGHYDQAVAKVQAEVKDIYRQRREVQRTTPTNSTEAHERQARLQELADEIQRRLHKLVEIKANFTKGRV